MLQKEKPCIKSWGLKTFEFEDQGKLRLSSGKHVYSVASEGQYQMKIWYLGKIRKISILFKSFHLNA